MQLRTISLVVLSLTLVISILGDATLWAAGPLEGQWTLTIVKQAGASAPFSAPANVFHFTQQSGFQAQNAPANGSGIPLCSMSGSVSGNILVGQEVCGIPRNSFGAVAAITDSSTFPRSIYMVMVDSKGVYWIRGSKN